MKRHQLRLEQLEGRDVPAVFLVTNNSSDVGTVGSLPWAVDQANTTPGLDYINFDLPYAQTLIQLKLEQRLLLTDQVHINGATQPAAQGSVTVIGLPPGFNNSGPNFGHTATYEIFHFGSDAATGRTSSGSTLEGLKLAMAGNSVIAIDSTSSGNWIRDNIIGYYFDANGQQVNTTSSYYPISPRAASLMMGFAYFPTCISIESNSNAVYRNKIAGGFTGVSVSGSASVNAIALNSITDNFNGIFVSQNASNNFFGPSNIISGNRLNGMILKDYGVTGNVIFQNAIGLDHTATMAMPNGGGSPLDVGYGVLITEGAHGNVVGGSNGGNWIAANKGGGVAIGLTQYAAPLGSVYFSAAFGGSASNNAVEFNVIGLNWLHEVVGSAEQTHGIIVSGSWYTVINGNEIGGHTLHGIMIGRRDFSDANPETSELSVVTNNSIGISIDGRSVANGGFGICIMPGARYNYFANIGFGDNLLGNLYIDPQADGNLR